MITPIMHNHEARVRARGGAFYHFLGDIGIEAEITDAASISADAGEVAERHRAAQAALILG